MNIVLAIIFFFALMTSVYFVIRFVIMIIDIVNDSHEPSDREVFGYNIVMVISIALWSLLFYFSL